MPITSVESFSKILKCFSKYKPMNMNIAILVELGRDKFEKTNSKLLYINVFTKHKILIPVLILVQNPQTRRVIIY